MLFRSANVINEAALLAVRRGKDQVSIAELQEAVERVIAGLEKKNRVLNKMEKERVAYHETGHALVALSMPGADQVQKISIIPRGVAALGYTLQLPVEEKFLSTEAELKDRWRQTVKYELLHARLDGQSDAEAAKTLRELEVRE